MSETAVTIRPMCDTDEDFIYSTWLKNYRFSSAFAASINDRTYYTFHHQIVDRILERSPDSRVACFEDSVDTILGYLILEHWNKGTILHYCYVKFPFRHEGIATQLLHGITGGGDTLQFTHLTEDTPFITKVVGEMNYNPYLI